MSTGTNDLDEPLTREAGLPMGLWVAVGCVVLALLGSEFVVHGRINHDEGWVLHAAQRLLDGKLPYRDFPFYQAPLLPFIHALPQAWDAGVETGRWTTLFSSVLTFVLALRLAAERGGLLAAGIVVLGIASSPLALWAFSTTRTEPLSALLLVVAATAMTRARPNAMLCGVALGAGVLAVGARVGLALAAIHVVAWAVTRIPGDRRGRIVALLPATLLAMLLLGVLFSGGFERAWFFLVDVQTERHVQFDAPVAFDAATWLATRRDLFAQLSAEFGWLSIMTLAAVAFWPLYAWRACRRKISDPAPTRLARVSTLVLLAFVPHLAPRHVYPVYFVAVLPLGLVVLGWTASRLLTSFERGTPARSKARVAAATLFLLLAAVQARGFVTQQHHWLSPEPSDLELLRTATREIEGSTNPDSLLLTFDTYLAVDAGRRVPKGFEMSVFSWFPKRPEEDAERLGVLTTARLNAAFRASDVGAVALSDQALGILVHGHHFGFQPKRLLDEAALQRALPVLRDFALVARIAKVGQQRAPLYLFERRAGTVPRPSRVEE